jgi:IK cytokine
MEKLADSNEKSEEIIEKEEIDDMEPKTVMGMNINRWIQMQKSKTVERNESFAPGRMAYLVELEEENVECDIPTTVVRSKAETNASTELNTLTSTHDIVVNKLAQIFSYLRQGGKKKNKKRDKEIFKIPEVEQKPAATTSYPESQSKSKKERRKEDDSIYGNIGDYKAPSHKERRRYSDERDRDDYRKSSSSSSSSRKHKHGSYFDKPVEEEVNLSIPAPPKLPASYISKLASAEIDGYAECYPGLEEMNDAVIDSDDEVDYSKMDKNTKKGAIGRWDFETQDEYTEYMSQREALPKAAFQYGLKMSEGRKTRKNKNENQKLDQEWQKIQKIITKRKGDGDGGEVEFKKSKH